MGGILEHSPFALLEHGRPHRHQGHGAAHIGHDATLPVAPTRPPDGVSRALGRTIEQETAPIHSCGIILGLTALVGRGLLKVGHVGVDEPANVRRGQDHVRGVHVAVHEPGGGARIGNVPDCHLLDFG